MPYQLDRIDPTKTVMIVVDMQNDFVAEGAKLRSAAAAAMVPKLASTLKFCREKGIKIIYTAHVHRRDGSDMGLYDDLYPPIADHSTLVDGTPGIEIFSGLAPAPGEHIKEADRASIKTAIIAYFQHLEPLNRQFLTEGLEVFKDEMLSQMKASSIAYQLSQNKLP